MSSSAAINLPSSPPRAGRWLLIAVAVVAILAARLIYVATKLEVALGLLRVVAQDATLGWLGRGHVRVGELPGDEQARFWLAETERIVADHHTSEMARAAAWMLSSPAAEMFVGTWQPRNLNSIADSPVWIGHRDHEAYQLAAHRARDEMAELATTLAPRDPLAWQTRAALADPPFFTDPEDPCHYVALLDEAAERDPTNALYDYLAARSLLFTSSYVFEVEDASPPDDLIVIVKDSRSYTLGLSHLECATAREDLQLCRDEHLNIARFLQLSTLPPHERPQWLSSRLIGNPMYWARDSFDRLGLDTDGAPADPWVASRGYLALAKQLTRGGSLTFPAWIQGYSRLAAHKLEAALKQTPAAVEAGKAARLREEIVDARAWLLALQTAETNLGPPATPPPDTAFELFRALAVPGALALGVLLAAIAIVAWLAAWLIGALVGRASSATSGPPRTWRFRYLRHLAAWIAAVAFSIVVYGLAPAQVIGPSTQDLIMRPVVALVPSLAIAGMLLYVLKRSRSRFAPLALLVAVPVFGAVMAAAQGPFIDYITFGRFRIPTRAVDGFRRQTIGAVIDTTNPFTWAGLQWYAWSGAVIAIGIALGVLAVWRLAWTRRRSAAQAVQQMSAEEQAAQPDRQVSTWPGCLSATAREVSCAAGAAALIALVTFLLAAPSFLASAQETYDWQMRYFSDPAARREQLLPLAEQIVADPAQWAEMTAWARQQLQSEVRP